MPFSERTQRFREQREADRKQRREEQRRLAAIERRIEEEKEKERQEQRRLEAIREWQEVELALDAARQHREELLMQVRARKQSEEQEQARRDRRHNLFLRQFRAIQQEASRNESRPKEKAEVQEPAEREREKDEPKREAARAERKVIIRHRPTRPIERPKPPREPVARLIEKPARKVENRPLEKRQSPKKDELDSKREESQKEDRSPASIAERQQRRREAERATGRKETRRSVLRVARRDAVRSLRREDRRREPEDTRPDPSARVGRDEPRPVRERETPESDRNQSPRPVRPVLQDRIPTGSISDGLPWLRVRHNHVVTLAGDPVILRGLVLPEMEAAGFTAALLDSILTWGGNIVRLAFNSSHVLHGAGGGSPADYLGDLDEIIQYASARQTYTLLSASGSTDSPEITDAWRVLGARYAGEPAALFDLYAGPESAFNSDWNSWRGWLETTIAEVRQFHPRALCFASGLNSGLRLDEFPLRSNTGDPIPNVVYTARLSPELKVPLPAIRSLASKQPVFVSEWNGARASLLWGEQIALNLRASGIGWAAADWTAAPANQRIAPTPFGTLVLRELRLTGELMLVPEPALFMSCTVGRF